MNTTRRDLIKKAAYVTPAILTLPAIPSFAQTGSGGGGGGDGGGLECPQDTYFCFYEQPDGSVRIGSTQGRPEPDPDALFCSCSS